ncbi:MAG: hypothetical protein ABI743_00800 [bacterium]
MGSLITRALRSTIVVGILGALLAYPVPSQAKAFNRFQFPPATSFPAPDTLTYEIVAKGDGKPGSETHKGSGSFSTRLITSGPYDKYEIVFNGTEPGGQTLGWTAFLDAKSLKPWGYTRRYTDERGTETLELTFADKQVDQVVTQINGEVIERKLSNFGDYTLMPLLFLAGRGLEFGTGNLFTTMLLNPEGLTFETPFVSIVGKEVIPVPAGIYECWKVEYKFNGDLREYGYYAVKDPRIVAQYETPDRIWRLTKHGLGGTKSHGTPKPAVASTDSNPTHPRPKLPPQ